MLPMRFFAVAAIALAPILNAMGTVSNLTGWLMVIGGLGYLMLMLGVRFDSWLHDIERASPRRRKVARVRVPGRALVRR
jgi:hypothetical protein